MEQINKVKVSFGRISWSSVTSRKTFAPWRHNSRHRSRQRQSRQQERKVTPRRRAISELCERHRTRWETLKTFVDCEQTVTIMWISLSFYFLDKGLRPKRWKRANKKVHKGLVSIMFTSLFLYMSIVIFALWPVTSKMNRVYSHTTANM